MKIRVPGEMTGWLGPIEFVNGVSVRLVSPRESNQLRAVMAGVEIVQDDGETVDELLMAHFPLQPLGAYLDGGTPSPSPFLTQWNGTYPDGYSPYDNVQQAVTKSEPEAPTSTAVEVVEPLPLPTVRWTFAQLEAIADEKGINGLRELAEPLGIKGRSIKDLIGELKSAGHAAESM